GGDRCRRRVPLPRRVLRNKRPGHHGLDRRAVVRIMSSIKFDFRDKAVLVTGGTRGIGAATVRAFLAAGARVAVNGHTAESTRQAMDQLGDGRAVAAPGDIGTTIGCRAAVEAALAAFGGLDVLVNNAGVFREVLIEDSDEAFWDRTININLKGTFFTAQAALP